MTQKSVRHIREDAGSRVFNVVVAVLLAVLSLLIIYPLWYVLIAFKKYKVSPGKGFLWSLIHNSPWCGLANFNFLFSSNAKTTIAMFRNTVCYNIVFIILGIVIPVALAILISHLYSKKLAKICQTAIFLPHFLSWVVVGYFVYAFLATKEGLVNIKGHRLVGGMRASIYNAMPIEGVEALVEFLKKYEAENA